MSFIDFLNDIIKAYYINDTEKIKMIMKTKYIQDMLNIGHVDMYYRSNLIEAFIKNTGMGIADLLIDNTHTEPAKQFVIDYCIAMLFKYNKYESAMLMTFKYYYNMGKIFNYMQEANTSNDILKMIFNKYHSEINTIENRNLIMISIGTKNNIELLSHIEQYYDISDDDITSILGGTINKKNIHNCLNTIKYIFENYEFDYDVNYMYNFIKELHFMEYDEAIYYVLTQLIQNNHTNYVNDFLMCSNMENYFYPIFVEYFITTFKNYIIPNITNNILNKLNINTDPIRLL